VSINKQISQNMDVEHLKLFQQALKLVAIKFQENNEIMRLETCCHAEIVTENGKKTCLECGEILEENYIANHHSSNIIGMKKRRFSESSIHNDIPIYIEQHIKDITIQIYQAATTSKNFRNTSKKSIILASLHRASALAGNHISYYDLLDMFNLKQHEANKGFTILSSNIPKKSEFKLKFDQTKEEMISISSKLRKIGMNNKTMFNMVVNVFNLIKQKSDIINTSQPNSIICGCIYFWIVQKGINKTDIEFSKTMMISTMTLLKVYVAVCDVVFNNTLKTFLSILLKNSIPKPNTGTKYKNILKKLAPNILYGPTQRFLVHDPFDPMKIRITTKISKTESQELPDEVDDITEWNLLLNQQYYGLENIHFINVKLIRKNDKEMHFDFGEFDKINEANGNGLLTSFLINKFDVECECEDKNEDVTSSNSHLLFRKTSCPTVMVSNKNFDFSNILKMSENNPHEFQ
jgi:transcription initiation factor TFIIIB Brf1 subunit/transcription initiation factor TFIIB